MKRILGVFILSIMMFTTIALAAYPEESEQEVNYDHLIEPISGEIMVEADAIEDDVFKSEQEVIINQIIDGNVYIMAKNLKISGAGIYGNVYAMAENIEIENSQINGSVYVMGEKVQLSGIMTDVYAMGNQVFFGEDLVIARNANVFSNQLDVKGNIGRNLYASINQLNVADSVVVAGKMKYFAESQGSVSENAQVGEIEFVQRQEREENYRDYIVDGLSIAFKTLVISLIIVFFVNKFKVLPRENAVTDLLQSVGKGIGVLILVPIISIALMISLIGAALGVSLLAIYLVGIYISTSIISLEIAYRIINGKNQEDKSNLVKVILLAILISVGIWGIGMLPRIGGTISFIFGLMGAGVLYDMIFRKIKQSNNGENNEN